MYFSCRVLSYIKYGWDQYLVDLDRGINCQKKLMSILPPQSLSYDLLRCLPDYDDSQWTSQLYKLLKVTFSTIYHHLVDRKVHLKKVSHLEEIAERNPDSSSEELYQMCANEAVPIEYTRTLSKAYVFLEMVMCRTLNTILFFKSLAMSL